MRPITYDYRARRTYNVRADVSAFAVRPGFFGRGIVFSGSYGQTVPL